MFTVGVRDHFMIAHSLRGELFGPAQRLHGVTYCATIEVEAPALNEHGIVIDMGLLRDRVRAVLGGLHYHNLDEHPAFAREGSTTERIARYIHAEVGRDLPCAAQTYLVVTLEESPAAFARYRAPLGGA